MGKVIIITGASGYLGQKIVLNAHQRGHKTKAVIRPGRDISNMAWVGLDNIEVVEIDLASDIAGTSIAKMMSSQDSKKTSVIHASAVMMGDDSVHNIQTIRPTELIVQSMIDTGLKRLVLVSSMSVYGYSAQPVDSQLDETTPIEIYQDQRDSYCRAKIAQESIGVKAAQNQGLVVTALRPGAIIGPGRLLTSRLGITKGKFALQLGRDARLPISFVDHCAEAIVLAAEKSSIINDVYSKPNKTANDGAFEAINVFEDELPTQQQYISLLKKHTDIWPAFSFTLPWSLIKKITSGIGLVTTFKPSLLKILPGVLKEASIHARIKPLRYNNSRLHDRLDWSSTFSYEEIIKLSKMK